MAIASFKPDAEVTPTPVLPAAQPENYQGLTYDNSQVPVTSLLSYVEGAPWAIKAYFRQVLGEHNDLKEIDPNLSASFQSYSRINQLELRVQSDLEGQTDATKQFTTVEGSALVYGFVIPNVNDYFIAETSYRREALFRLTNVDRLTWRRESVHGIQYVMVDYIEHVSRQIKDLEHKTTSTYVFARDRLMEGLAPILRTEDYEMVNNLKAERTRIGKYYLNTFTVNSSRTLNVPGQPNVRIYDSFLVDFVLATFGFLEFPETYRIRQIPKDGDYYLEAPQFWSAILRRDINDISLGNQQMGITCVGNFQKNTHLATSLSARTDFFVYPYSPDTSMNSGEDRLPLMNSSAQGIKGTTGAHGAELTVDEKRYTILGKGVQAYAPISGKGYYVLSESFYKGDRSNMTLIEMMVSDYLESKTLDLKQLTFLVRLYPRMERMAQFYLGPLLMTLLRYADQRTYS